MPTNLPGGRILASSASYLNVINPFTGVMNRLDVLQVDVDKMVRVWQKGHSGTLSALAARAVAQTFEVSGVCWWDIANSPCVQLLQAGWGCGLQVAIGSLAGQAMYGYSQAQAQFWFLPAGILQRLRCHQNDTGEEQDGIVTGEFTVVGNSMPFLLPDELAAAQTYTQQLQALGQYTALGTFFTQQ